MKIKLLFSLLIMNPFCVIWGDTLQCQPVGRCDEDRFCISLIDRHANYTSKSRTLVPWHPEKLDYDFISEKKEGPECPRSDRATPPCISKLFRTPNRSHEIIYIDLEENPRTRTNEDFFILKDLATGEKTRLDSVDGLCWENPI